MFPSLLSALGLGVELFFVGLAIEVHLQLRKFVAIEKLCFVLFLVFLIEAVGSYRIMYYFSLFVAVELFDVLILFIIAGLQVDFDIFVLYVDKRSFLVRAKEHVLLIIVDSFEWFDAVVIEVRRADICTTGLSFSQVSLQKQVVCCSDVIVFIGLDAPLSVL